MSATLLILLFLCGLGVVLLAAMAAVALQTARARPDPASIQATARELGVTPGAESMDFIDGAVRGRVTFDSESCPHQSRPITRFEFSGPRRFKGVFSVLRPGGGVRPLLSGTALARVDTPSGCPTTLQYSGDTGAANDLDLFLQDLIGALGLARFELRIQEDQVRLGLLGHVTEPESIAAVRALLVAFLTRDRDPRVAGL